jgi:polysaccharide biosynthesis/export protein
LKHLFNEPIVTIILRDTETQTYKVIGRVQRPGLYNVLGPVRLRDAIALAGGLQSESYKDKTSPLQQIANLQDSFIVRKGRKLNVDFEELLFGPSIENDIYVHPGDYIYIASYETRVVYVMGAIRNPMAITWRNDLTMMGAIATAGAWPLGGAYSPDIKKTLLLRGSLDDPTVTHMDLSKIVKGEARDFYLQPGDMIYLPDKGFRFARELVRLAINTFVQSFGSAAGSFYGEVVLFPVFPHTSSSSTSSIGE